MLKDGSRGDERAAGLRSPVSGRHGQAPLLFLPPRSKYHLCESAAAWPPGTLLPDAPFPPFEVRAKPLPPDHLKSLLGSLVRRRECRTQQQDLFLHRLCVGL